MDNESDPECVFFQDMADTSHYGKDLGGDSRQGTYVFTAAGKSLASINDLSPDAMLQTLEQGLAAWEQLSQEDRRSKNEKVAISNHRWEHFYPKDGLVLTIHSRDLPESVHNDRLPTWNRDTAWFSKEEVAAMVPADVQVGTTFAFPPAFTQRLARFHFVDSVKGQTEAFGKKQSAESKIEGRVTDRAGDRIAIAISGHTLGQTSGKKNNASKRKGRGVETDLLGTAVYDVGDQSFHALDMVAMGQRWGRTRFNDRRRQMEPTSIGYVLEMAPRDATPMIPGIIWSYDAPWLEHPTD